MASNRAAVQGQIHAYRIGLTEEEMEMGSVAWSSDEVAGEGLVLRVYSQGEEIAARSLDGSGAQHLPFAGQAGVRVVLENASGRIVAESFAEGEGAWELRKSSSGWQLEDQSDVMADWAMLADLQTEEGTAVLDAGDSMDPEVSDIPAKESSGPDWSSLLDGDAPAISESGSEEELAQDIGPGGEAGDVGLLESRDSQGGEGTQSASPDDKMGETARVEDGKNEGEVEQDEKAEQVAVAEELRAALEEGKAPSAKRLNTLLETDPDAVIEAWEEQARKVLLLERDFLDSPSFSLAGELYDGVETIEAWGADADLISPLLRDGIDTEDISDMLDKWTRAVQSATKASLAKVAGDAALALRREKLAIRELQEVGGADLNAAKSRWSDWRDAGRAVPGVDPRMADWDQAEGTAVLEDWSRSLDLAESRWSRKELAGWRGDWLRREREQMERRMAVWDAHWQGATEEDLVQIESGEMEGFVPEAWAENKMDRARSDEVQSAEDSALESVEAIATAGNTDPETPATGSDNVKNTGAGSEWEADQEFDAQSTSDSGVSEGVGEESRLESEADIASSLPENLALVRLEPLNLLFPALAHDGEEQAMEGASEDGIHSVPEEMVSIESQVNAEWEAALFSSNKSRRLWEKLMEAVGDQGWSAPENPEALEALPVNVRSLWEDWSESVLEVLADWHEVEEKGMQSTLDSLGSLAEETDWSSDVKAAVAERWNEVQTELMTTHDEQARQLSAVSSDAMGRMNDLGPWRSDVVDARAQLNDWVNGGFWSMADAIVEQMEAIASEDNISKEDVADESMEGRFAEDPKGLDREGAGLEVDDVRQTGVDLGTNRVQENGREEAVASGNSTESRQGEPSQDVGQAQSAEAEAAQTDGGLSDNSGAPSDQVEPSKEDSESVETLLNRNIGEGEWRSSSPSELTVILSEARIGLDGPQLDQLCVELSQFSEVRNDRIELWGQEEWNREWSIAEWNFLNALEERLLVADREPAAGASRAERMAWDKEAFFADRSIRRALEELDVPMFQRHIADVLEGKRGAGTSGLLGGNGETASDRVAMEGVRGGANDIEEEEIDSRSGGIIEGRTEVGETEVSDGETVGVIPAVDPTVMRAMEEQVEQALEFGVTLPEAEVVARRTDGNRGGGLRLRPIAREEMERSILGNNVDSRRAESASNRFADDRGAPTAVGVEYKIQVGAFRNALPAALFAAFDPMWAQSLSNGITRYMAGSFDAYDPAVVARDAIRALGYSDAFVVRFVDGERVSGASRPDAVDLAEERRVRAAVPGMDALAVAETGAGLPVTAVSEGAPGSVSVGAGGVGESPTRPEEIPTWDDVQGRVFSVQVGAFRGIPDREAMSKLGTLTREDAGSDGWLRLFSGRFMSQQQAAQHRAELQSQGFTDAFIVVYINGRRIPLSQASTTSISPLPGNPSEGDAAVSTEDTPVLNDRDETPALEDGGYQVELGVFNSTIPVRLANAILDAPLDWEIRSERNAGLTQYRTRMASRETAEAWLVEARVRGFANARLIAE